MFQRFAVLAFTAALVFLIALSVPSASQAESLAAPDFAGTPYDLVNAVNVLRTSNGLSAYSINSILMFTAQNQADFMAATGSVTHTGAGGSSVTSRLLAAGYPLAGDLSLGGFRSENIISGSESMTAQAAVNAWTGDAPHLNTMLSANLTEIGAGVAVANGRVYYVIDAALPTTGGVPQAVVTTVEGESNAPAGEAVVSPVVLATPNADGNVIHEVLAGQSLWQIAVAYEVKIDDIKRLNNLSDNNIYSGDKLLIRKESVFSIMSPTASPAPEVLLSPTITPSSTIASAQPAGTLIPSPVATSGGATQNKWTMGIVMGIIVLALLGGGAFARLGNARRE